MQHRPKNIDAKVIEVDHSALRRWSSQSVYKVHCPACTEGLLLVGRDPKTFQLLELDRCVLCGQLVRYLDIEELRKQEGG